MPMKIPHNERRACTCVFERVLPVLSTKTAIVVSDGYKNTKQERERRMNHKPKTACLCVY